ncbi:hypothetical protein B0F90DRAFT_1086695 [Multifurca ochricompacta]|uniref:Ribonuclease H1 N-terminal domain-containing protein n=1 Tax=Multifurca ochricompacta TaxID=376703 RepID=A0AAD4M8A7_9AGAM|nr:hypothetical protein B0F90DRAFT_1086695 [Multifurca ochricompacta]
MVKWYYIVIVGTRPGIYGDWSQAAPKVSEISGAIHKKFKTYAEAREAFDKAEREGEVRAIQVDLAYDAKPSPSYLPSQVLLSTAADNRRHSRFQVHAQNPRLSQEGPHNHTPMQSARYSDARLGRHFHRNPTSNVTGTDIVHPSRNVSCSNPSHDTGFVEAIGVELETHCMSEPHRDLNWGSSAYIGNVRQLSTPSPGPADHHIRVPGHTGQSNRWINSRNGEKQKGTSLPRVVDTAILPGTVQAEPQLINTRQGSHGNPGTAVLQSSQSSRSRHGISPLSQVEGDRGVLSTTARTQNPSLDTLQAPNIQAKFEFEGSETPPNLHFPQLCPLYDQLIDFDATHVHGNQSNSGSSFASPQAQDRDNMNSNRKTSVQSVGGSFDSSEWLRTPHLQSWIETNVSLNAAVLSRPPSVCSHISLASSTETFESTISFDVDLSAQVETSEGHENAPSSPSLLTASPSCFAVPSLVDDTVPGLQSRSQARSQVHLSEAVSEGNMLLKTSRYLASSSGLEPPGGLHDAASPTAHTLSLRRDHQNADDNSSTVHQSSPPPIIVPVSPIPTHLRTQGIRLSLVESAASSLRQTRTSFLPSHTEIEVSRSSSAATTSLELVTGDVALPSSLHPFAQLPAAQDSPEGLFYPRSGRPEVVQCPTQSDAFSCDAPPESQCQASSLYRSPVIHSSRSAERRLMDSPLSPALSTSRASTRLQAQPSHRQSPDMPLYPSLAGEGLALLDPSGLDIVFGLPTPGLSPIQAPAVIRSPSMDPRSPILPWTQIPSNAIGNLCFGRPTPARNDP